MNKRKHVRVPVEGKAQHSIYKIFETPIFESSSAIDISESGVSFVSQKKYREGDLVLLEVSLPGWEKEKDSFLRPLANSFEPVKVLVRVKWVAREQKHYRVGAEMSAVDLSHQRALERFLKKKEEE